MKHILTVTDKASVQLEKIIQSAPSDTVGILVGVDKTGCNGYSYKLDFAKKDEVDNLEYVEQNSIKVFLDPKAKNLKQSDIVEGNGIIKGNEPFVARFVNLYNSFCDREVAFDRMKIKGTHKTAIPFEGSDSTAWNKFLADANPLMKPVLGQLAEQKFF